MWLDIAEDFVIINPFLLSYKVISCTAAGADNDLFFFIQDNLNKFLAVLVVLRIKYHFKFLIQV